MITKVINVNLHQPIYERLTAKQGDIASRYLLFHLLDGDKPFDLSNKTVRVYAIKPDKTEIFNDLTINDASKGYCTLELTSQCLASAGVVKMELYISQSGKVLTSIPFELEVIACINTVNSVTSTNEFSALEVALSSLQDYNNLRREIIQARKGHATVGGRLDNFDSQLDTKMNLEVGKKAYVISGVIRNSGNGWELIDDEGHNNINITSVSQDESNKTISVVYPSALKVGNFNVSTDETLARMNIRCGASVSLNKASIKCYTDFTGYFNGSGLIVSQKGTWFDGTYTFTPLSDGTGFNLVYDGDESSIRPSVQVTSYADSGMNTQEMRVKVNSSTSVDFRTYGDLEGKLICDGTTFTLETSCVANISFSYTNGVLDITHISGSTETEFNRFNNVQLTSFISDLSGEIIQPKVFSCTRNKIRIAFYDKTGTQITSPTPLKNMSLMFARPNLKVPQKIDKLGVWYFNCGSTILRPSKFISVGGNLWLTGTQQI